MAGVQGDLYELTARASELHLSDNEAESSATISDVPDKIMLSIFSLLPHKALCTSIPLVCKKWRILAYDGRLWKSVSFRSEYSNLNMNSMEALLSLINIRFGNLLQYLELPCDLITIPVLHELAQKCPNLKYLTLDFSRAMQLHDFNDLNSFPCNLKMLCICLSEVIFMEGLMRRIYSCLSSLQILHLIGTFEMSNEGAEEIYEVINVGKIKAHTPNLRVVNFYGVSFVDDTHVELLSSNCIHLETLALNYCLRVKGSSFKVLLQRCKKMKTLLLRHTSVEDKYMCEPQWQGSVLSELDVTSTELSAECLKDVLLRLPPLSFLAVGHCDFFNDEILEAMMDSGKMCNLTSIDMGYTCSLSEKAALAFLKQYGSQLLGLMLNGKANIHEQFWLTAISYLVNCRHSLQSKVLPTGMTMYPDFLTFLAKLMANQPVPHSLRESSERLLTKRLFIDLPDFPRWHFCQTHVGGASVLVLGTANGGFLGIHSKVHVDQIMQCLAHYCHKLERLEMQWDPETVRYSDKSTGFIDQLRIRCHFLKSLTLSDGEYYEMVKSNFERADRRRIVRSLNNYNTTILSLLRAYSDLLFN